MRGRLPDYARETLYGRLIGGAQCKEWCCPASEPLEGLLATIFFGLPSVGLLRADEVFQGVRGPNGDRSACPPGVHPAAIACLLYALPVKDAPTFLEIAALVVETDVVDLSTPCRHIGGFDGVHLSSAVGAHWLLLHMWSSPPPDGYHGGRC